jgi:hypothetical protein
MMMATGTRKVDAVAAVVAEMFAQQKMMQAKMMAMKPRAMGHLMKHMAVGKGMDMEKSMAICPMMKRMVEESGLPAPWGDEDHSAHHPEK